MRPTHELSRCSSGFLAGALGAASGLPGAVSLLAVQAGTAAIAGSSGRRTGAYLWFVGPSVGTAGRRGALRTGGAVGSVAVGSDHQRHGCMAGGTALGAGGGRLQGSLEPGPRRQPEGRA